MGACRSSAPPDVAPALPLRAAYRGCRGVRAVVISRVWACGVLYSLPGRVTAVLEGFSSQTLRPKAVIVPPISVVKHDPAQWRALR